MSKGRQVGATGKAAGTGLNASARETKRILSTSGAVPLPVEKVYRPRRKLSAAEQGLEEARVFSRWNI